MADALEDTGRAPPAEDSDGEDEVPDYLRLLGAKAGVIPKRGEKDFEPTGFGGQAKLLEKSREAMYEAVSGERRVGSKTLVRATWDDKRNRALLHDLQGKIFETIGVVDRSIKGKTRNELLPEEALFMVERGSLQLYSPPSGTTWEGELDTSRQAPMSVQQAFTYLLHADQLNRAKYLIYTHLKRLGYVVQRADVVDAARSTPLKNTGIIADPKRPIRLVKIWDLFLYIPRRLAQLGGDLLEKVASWLAKTWRRSRSTEQRQGLLGVKRWSSYDAVFNSLQIVPSRQVGSPTLSSLRPKHADTEQELKPFFYAWRPATLYRKSHPPPPEFRIVVVDTRTQSLPSLWQFEQLFAKIPITGSDQELGEGLMALDSQEQERRLAYEREIKAKNDLKNRAAYGKYSDGKQKFLAEKAQERKQQFLERQQRRDSQLGEWKQAIQRFWRSQLGVQLWQAAVLDYAVLRTVARLFQHAPSGCVVRNGTRPRPKTVNVFPLLKAGRKSVVLAVVDGSTTTLLRFGEADFSTHKLLGTSM